MTRFHVGLVAALVVACVLGGVPVGLGASAAMTGAPPLSAMAAVPVERVRWLAAGDSYSAGEGLPGVATGEAAETCQRATGKSAEPGTTPSEAYPVVAAKLLEAGRERVGDPAVTRQPWPAIDMTFVACTGAMSDALFRTAQPGGPGETQFDEARGTGFDVLSFSFGGNDIGFADVLSDCVVLPEVLVSWLLASGCDVSEAEVQDRIDRLVRRPQSASGDEAPGPLPKLFDDLARNRAVRPGGAVIVVGYPQLFADAGQRSPGFSFLCEGVFRGDIEKLRRLTDYLNVQLYGAVEAAKRDYPEYRWEYVDLVQRYEPAGGVSHALCSKTEHDGGEWLNGLSTGLSDGDWRFPLTPARSFHPNQLGHRAAGEAVAAAAYRAWRPLPTIDHVDLGNVTLPAGSCSGGAGPPSLPIRLRDGVGEAGQVADNSYVQAETSEDPTYADLDGDGNLDAVLVVLCNWGGTYADLLVLPLTANADGVALVGGRSLGAVAGLEPESWSRIAGARLEGADIVVDESYKIGDESLAGFSGQARVVWRWAGTEWQANITRVADASAPFPYLYQDVPQLGSERVRGSGCGAVEPIGEVIPDGIWAGHVASVEATNLEFDLVCIYFGDDGKRRELAWLAANPDSYSYTDGEIWWEENNNPRTRRVALAPEFEIRAAEYVDGTCRDVGRVVQPGELIGMHSWLVISGGSARLLLESCPYG